MFCLSQPCSPLAMWMHYLSKASWSCWTDRGCYRSYQAHLYYKRTLGRVRFRLNRARMNVSGRSIEGIQIKTIDRFSSWKLRITSLPRTHDNCYIIEFKQFDSLGSLKIVIIKLDSRPDGLEKGMNFDITDMERKRNIGAINCKTKSYS